MIVQACLNGARPASFHPALPWTPETMARDAAACVAAGANELHFHPRDRSGAESLAPDVLAATVNAVRHACPETPIGVSTGAWIEKSAEQTLACIGGWRVRLDYASVNLCDSEAPAIMDALWSRGIGVEAGLADTVDVRRLAAIDPDRRTLRVLVEIEEQDETEAVAAAHAVLSLLDEKEIRCPVLLHGQDETLWPLIGFAAQHGFSTRVGLEDGSHLPDGATAPDNAALVRQARRIVTGA